MNLLQPSHAGLIRVDAVVDAATFADRGFVGPVSLLSDGQRNLLLNHLAFGERIEPETWDKGRAATDRLLFDFACHPELLALLRPHLGNDIVLWGVSVQERRPGQAHAWHVDIESAAPGWRFASVWIGLVNTSRESGLSLIGGSHRFGKTIQEVQHDKGWRRGQASDETVLAWAKEFDGEAALFQPGVTDGDALIFDGRLWHGSLNRRETGTRTALLLQYAEADAAVFMISPDRLEWPFKPVTSKRPPVITVSGTGNADANRVVLPPPTSPSDALTLITERHVLSALPDPGRRKWQPYPLFQGLSTVHDFLTCHASVLSPGAVPHPPHAHIEEEILIVLDGQAELLVGDGPNIDNAKRLPAGLGTFVYYPAYQHHTLRNAGSAPLTYLMFKWRGGPATTEDLLAIRIVDSSNRPSKPPKPWRTWLLLEGPTNYLGKLHVHYSEVAPGGGYEPHSDEYDVAIVVLAGTIETLGQRVEPFGVVYYAADQAHGLRCVGETPAHYLVFEFHSPNSGGDNREKMRGKTRKGRSPLLKRLKKLAMAPIRHYTKRR
jgi:quercetin dioxygenase-like cupin family protein